MITRLFLSLMLALLPLALTAAPLPQGVGAIDAGQLEQRFAPQPKAQSRPKPLQLPKGDGVQAPEGADKIRFQLRQIQLEGNSVFSSENLQPLYQNLLEQEISLDQLYKLAADITAHYGNAGYLLSRALVPEQTIEAGLVRLRILEGYVEQVVVEGMQGQRPQLFQHYMDRITADRPLNAKVLERCLLLANDLPGVRFRSLMEASKQQPGAAVLRLVAERRDWDAGFGLDNRGSESSGPWQMMIDATRFDQFGRLDATSLRHVTVPGQYEELRYWQLGHQQVLNGEGLRLTLDLSRTRSEPGGDILRQLDLESRGDSLALGLSYPLIRSREENLSLSASLTLRKSETLQLGNSTLDRLRVARLGLSYDRADNWFGGGVSLLSLNLVQGLNLNNPEVNSRADARPDFSKLDLQLRRSQRLTEGLSLDLRLQGQLANETLPSSQQFGLGGENSVRGYEPSEWSGDRGLTGGLELRHLLPVNWQGGAEVYAFYEEGRIARHNPQGQSRTESVSAFGLGTRMNLPRNISLNLEAARARDDHVNGDPPDWNLYGRLTARF